MIVGTMPAKRHAECLPSGGATAVDGADDENVGEAVHPMFSHLPKRVNPSRYVNRHFWKPAVADEAGRKRAQPMALRPLYIHCPQP